MSEKSINEELYAVKSSWPSTRDRDAVCRWGRRSVQRGVELSEGVIGVGAQLESPCSRPTMRRRAAFRPKSPLNVCCKSGPSSWTSCDAVRRSPDSTCRLLYNSGSDDVADGLKPTAKPQRHSDGSREQGHFPSLDSPTGSSQPRNILLRKKIHVLSQKCPT